MCVNIAFLVSTLISTGEEMQTSVVPLWCAAIVLYITARVAHSETAVKERCLFSLLQPVRPGQDMSRNGP